MLSFYDTNTSYIPIFEFIYYAYLAEGSVFTGNESDIKILKKECQDLDKLLIPACKVDLMMVLGEGIVNSIIVAVL